MSVKGYRPGKEFPTSTPLTRGDSRKTKSDRRNKMAAIHSESEIEYLGVYIDSFKDRLGTHLKLTGAMVQLTEGNSKAEYMVGKLKVLLEMMKHNANFVLNAIDCAEPLSSQELKSGPVMQDFIKIASFRSPQEHSTNININNYSNFISTIRREFSYSEKSNSTYINNRTRLLVMVESIAKGDYIKDKKELKTLVAEVKEVMAKHADIDKYLKKNPDCLQKFCQEAQIAEQIVSK